MNPLIGIAGRAGAGKTTIADHLLSKAMIKDAYGAIMKQSVSVMFDIPMDILLGDNKIKSQIDPYWQLSYRQILQKFGTDACRNTFGQDVWVKAFWRKYSFVPFRGLVIDDVRFENEAIEIRRRGGIIIRVVRDSVEPKRKWYKFGIKEHKSEKPLPDFLIDYTVENNGSKVMLYSIVDEIVRKYHGYI